MHEGVAASCAVVAIMRFWTTQSEKVIEIILNDGTYKPDFMLSNGLGGASMKEGYCGILNEYKRRNSVNCTGLVFGITELDDSPIQTIGQFKDYFEENSTFWDSVSCASSKYAILELEISDEFDIIPIYFQDFIVISLRAIKDANFNNFVKSSLVDCVFQDFRKDLEIAQSEGWVAREDYFTAYPLYGHIVPCLIESVLNKITQAHFHQISLSNVKSVFETYDFGSKTVVPLGPYASELRKRISQK